LIAPRDEFDRKLALDDPQIMVVLSEQETRIGCLDGDLGLYRAVVWTRNLKLRLCWRSPPQRPHLHSANIGAGGR
jgi:hypothetical protein